MNWSDKEQKEIGADIHGGVYSSEGGLELDPSPIISFDSQSWGFHGRWYK